LPGIGTLKDITRFDAVYFGVPPKHVHMMDPQLRMILELIYVALLDAGELCSLLRYVLSLRQYTDLPISSLSLPE
jgi:acyl transferase domain-containing protein